MKKITYKNAQTGLTITVEGPVVCVREGKDEEKMHLGSAQYAAEIALDLARVMRASEVKEQVA